MTTLPVQLLKKLNRTLENCDPFKHDDTLHSLFIDPRLSPWRRGLPQATDVQNRVNQMIVHLLPKYNAHNENALALFLQVLAEWHDPQDRMHLELQALATEVTDALAAPPAEPAPRPQPPVPPQPADSSSPKKWSWGWGLGGLVLLLGLMGGWNLWAADQPPLPPTTVTALVDAPPTATAALIGTNTSVPPTLTPTNTPRPTVPAGMVLVPAGEFNMGSNDGYSGERPAHTVYLDAFYIDQYEVTNSQFRACVEAGVCEAPITCTFGNPTYEDSDKANHPVVCVDWPQANTYCEFANKRLPTEAEWEKAARGTDGRLYPWGNEFDGSKLNFCDTNCPEDWKLSKFNDGYARTAPVGSYASGQSPYGAYDMAGNVWEWVADCYDSDYYSQTESKNPNPLNNSCSSSDYKVVRGGSWHDNADNLRAANRYYGDPDNSVYYLGFRCVVSP